MIYMNCMIIQLDDREAFFNLFGGSLSWASDNLHDCFLICGVMIRDYNRSVGRQRFRLPTLLDTLPGYRQIPEPDEPEHNVGAYGNALFDNR